MSNILCMYYSRTGNTKKAMEEIAQDLGAELVELRDDVVRSGWKGFLRCGMDAMGKSTAPLCPYETKKPLDAYDLVILGTPVWAGRCSSIVRTFLKEHGGELKNVAYVATRASESKHESVFKQMDLYTSRPMRRRFPCGAAPWAALSGRRSFCGRCARWRRASEPALPGTWKGAGPCWKN